MEFKVFGVPVRLDVAIACIILGCIICSLIFCNCTPVLKEGMAPIGYKMGEGLPNSWENFTVSSHQPTHGSAETILAGNVAPNPETQLDQGQLFMFAENRFSPMCCPSIYSGSEGCACMSPGQATFLNERGGNRTQTTIY